MNGLNALCHYDERFNRFRGNLFHPSSVNIQRELKSKEVINNYFYYKLSFDCVFKI